MPDNSASQASSSCGTTWIVRLQDNDSIAWNELVELYGPLVFHWCVSSKLQSTDAADVMQDVFSSAAKSIHQFKTGPGSTLRGWIWTITQNKIRDFCRKQGKQILATGGTEANWQIGQLPEPWGDSMDESADQATGELETHRLLHRALEQIKGDFQPQTWTAFWRNVMEGHDTNSIANETGMSPNGVRQAKSRVLRKLREKLGEI